MGESDEEEFCVEDEVCDGDGQDVVDSDEEEFCVEDEVDEVIDEVVDEVVEGVKENGVENVADDKAQEITEDKSNEKINKEDAHQKITRLPPITTMESSVANNDEKATNISDEEDTLKEETCVYEAAQLSPLPLEDVGKEVEMQECLKVIEIVEISDDERLADDVVSKKASKDKRSKTSTATHKSPVAKSKTSPAVKTAESSSEPKEVEKDDESSLILQTKEKIGEEMMNQRKEPLPEVALFVDSLTQVSFDWKKYTCFYCGPCQIYVTNTALWEEHMSHSSHKKNIVRWKACNALQKEIKRDTKPKHEKDVISCKELIAGADLVTEVSNSSGDMRHFVCRLCNSVSTSVEFLLSHLTGFSHVDNFMEHVAAYLYVPPTRNSLPDESTTMRKVTPEIEKRITDEARRFINRYGRGKMTAYSGDLSKDFLEANEEQEELEETVLASQVNEFLSEEKTYNITCDMRSSVYSVANKEYEKLNSASKDLYIGLQYLLELWAPSRRVIAVWYCMLCDSLVIDWTKHCEAVQHIAAYLKKDYKKYVFDCAVLEANNEEELRNNFIIAKSKVLQLEGYKARIKNVIHIKKMHEFESFVAINAKIAKQLVKQYKIEIGSPPRKPAQKSVPPSKSPKNGSSSQTKPSSKLDKPNEASSKRSEAPKNGSIATPSPVQTAQDKQKSSSESTQQVKKPDQKDQKSSQNSQTGPAKMAPPASSDRGSSKTSSSKKKTDEETGASKKREDPHRAPASKDKPPTSKNSTPKNVSNSTSVRSNGHVATAGQSGSTSARKEPAPAQPKDKEKETKKPTSGGGPATPKQPTAADSRKRRDEEASKKGSSGQSSPKKRAPAPSSDPKKREPVVVSRSTGTRIQAPRRGPHLIREPLPVKTHPPPPPPPARREPYYPSSGGGGSGKNDQERERGRSRDVRVRDDRPPRVDPPTYRRPAERRSSDRRPSSMHRETRRGDRDYHYRSRSRSRGRQNATRARGEARPAPHYRDREPLEARPEPSYSHGSGAPYHGPPRSPVGAGGRPYDDRNRSGILPPPVGPEDPRDLYPTRSTAGPFVFLTKEDLSKFTEVMRAVGVDLGRPLVMEDLQMLRNRFPDPEVFDSLLGNLLNQPAMLGGSGPAGVNGPSPGPPRLPAPDSSAPMGGRGSGGRGEKLGYYENKGNDDRDYYGGKSSSSRFGRMGPDVGKAPPAPSHSMPYAYEDSRSGNMGRGNYDSGRRSWEYGDSHEKDIMKQLKMQGRDGQGLTSDAPLDDNRFGGDHVNLGNYPLPGGIGIPGILPMPLPTIVSNLSVPPPMFGLPGLNLPPPTLNPAYLNALNAVGPFPVASMNQNYPPSNPYDQEMGRYPRNR